jgi:hypothetical protein
MSKYFQIVLTQQLLAKGYQAVKGFTNSIVGTLVQGSKSREKHPEQAVANCKIKKGIFQAKLHFWN